MKKDSSEEKIFLEYLDRLLAGEQIAVGSEVSDEARAALEHAWKMMTLRQEPSAAFRAELRARLLRQMAQKQESTSRAGFWERFDSVLPPKPVLVAAVSTVAVLLLAFVGVVWYAGRYATSPLATVPTPPAVELFPRGYSPRLPANIVPKGAYFTANTSLSDIPDKAMVYIRYHDDITAADATIQGRYLGFFRGKASLSSDGTKYIMTQGSGEDEKQLTVWIHSGAIEYGYVSTEKLYPSISASLPSEYDAKRIALNFLDYQAHLWPGYSGTRDELINETIAVAGGGYSVSKQYATEAAPAAASEPSAPSVTAPAEETTSSAPPGTTYWLVEFPYFVDGMEATGPGSKIEVGVGDNGDIINLNWPGRRFGGSVGKMAVISPQQAYMDLTQGKGSLDVPLDCRQVVVDQVQLKY